MNARTIPYAAKWLGYSGVLPFAALAIAYVMGSEDVRSFSLQGFVYYGAVILSFLGGIRWGLATCEEAFAGAATLSVLPSLWAFGCLLVPDQLWGVVGLLAGFLLMGALDRWAPPRGGAGWMVTLRIRLTSSVVACFALLLTAMLTD